MKRYVALIVLAACCFVTIVYVNGLNLFVVQTDSTNEVMQSLVVRGIELQKDVSNPIVCSDNIRGYNLTGYTLMNSIDLQKKADLEGNTPFIGIGVPRISGDDVYINVVRNLALPSDSGLSYSAASGAEYRFHRYFWRIWGYSINAIIMS